MIGTEEELKRVRAKYEAKKAAYRRVSEYVREIELEYHELVGEMKGQRPMIESSVRVVNSSVTRFENDDAQHQPPQ